MTFKKNEPHRSNITPLTHETGQPRIVTSGYYIQTQKKTDLKMPTFLTTADNMALDDAVYNSIDITNLLVITALYGGECVAGKSGSKKSRDAADFINYCLHNMSYGTWLDALQNIVTDLKYGFSILNIVLERRMYGQYKGSFVLKKLSPRDQKSIYGWLWDKNQRELLGFVQQPPLKSARGFKLSDYKNGLTALSVGKYYDSIYPIIRREQMLHFKYNSTNNNPQGDPPCMHCYTAWMEKRLIEEYEVIGISKDLGGIVVLRVPSELIEKANDPTNFPEEAAEYQALQTNTADLHAGKSSFLLLTSDTDISSKKYLYDFELKGIDGGGKQYQTSEIINQKKKSIYNVFGTGHMLLGQDSVGSYNLASAHTSTHSYYVERNILQKIDVINTQLIPRLLAANNIYLDWKDVPVFQPKSPTPPDKDVISKTIQRIKSVNGLTPSALEHLYKQLDWPTDGIEDIDFNDKGKSRAADGMKTPGFGTSTSVDGTDHSIANNENTATKNLVFDSEDDDTITLVDTETDEPIFIPKD